MSREASSSFDVFKRHGELELVSCERVHPRPRGESVELRVRCEWGQIQRFTYYFDRYRHVMI
eukprot:scaffold29331_cov60-Phaeocystis_antarctica.AAC.2